MKIHIYKVFGNDGGWTSTSNLIAAVSTLVQAPSSQASFISHNLFSTAFQDENCVENGANVINMSLGGSPFSRTEDEVFRRILNDDNVLLVA